eukprot:g4016.t1
MLCQGTCRVWTVTLCLFLLVCSGWAKELPKDTVDWDIDQCVAWAKKNGLDMETTIRKHEVNGRILLLVDDSDLADEFGIESSLQRKKILAMIEDLKTSSSSDHKLTFWELRSMSRQQVDYSLPLMVAAPRWAITTFDDFPSYCQPDKELGENHNTLFTWLEWIFFPEWYIWTNRDTIMCGLPFTTSVCVVVHLMVKVVVLVLNVAASGLGVGLRKDVVEMLKRVLLMELLGGSLAYVFSAVFFPIIPWFICDLFFYMNVYLTPISILLGGLKEAAVAGGIIPTGNAGKPHFN